MDECSICLGALKPLNNNKDIYITHCGHVFHTTCIYNWLISSDDCPYCRHILVEIGWISQELFDVLVEHCPSREVTVWRRITMYSRHPNVDSIQRIHHNQSICNIYIDSEDIDDEEDVISNNSVETSLSDTVTEEIHQRRSKFKMIKNFVRKALRALRV